MAIGNRGRDWQRVQREAQADADRRQETVYLYGDSVRGFYSTYVPLAEYVQPTKVVRPQPR